MIRNILVTSQIVGYSPGRRAGSAAQWHTPERPLADGGDLANHAVVGPSSAAAAAATAAVAASAGAEAAAGGTVPPAAPKPGGRRRTEATDAR